MYKVFDFLCKHCGNKEMDLLIKPEDAPECPKCNSIMTKMVSSPGMVKTNFHDKPKVRERGK